MASFIDKPLNTFEFMTVTITELRQRVEALEGLALEQRPLTEMPEVDRSHDVVIGARVDPRDAGY